jgi:hypothetical protein
MGGLNEQTRVCSATRASTTVKPDVGIGMIDEKKQVTNPPPDSIESRPSS